MKFNDLSNKKKAEYYRKNYKNWKAIKIYDKAGFFLVYNDFKNKNILKKVSGNAIKCYLYLGISSKNDSGESWHTVERIATYFEVSTRTVSNWLAELEKYNLIKRLQFDMNEVSHTFLQPY